MHETKLKVHIQDAQDFDEMPQEVIDSFWNKKCEIGFTGAVIRLSI